MHVANPKQTAVLVGMFLLANIANAIYFALHVRPSAAFYLLYYVGVAWAFAAWVDADARTLNRPRPFDAEWFTFIAWPVVVPYHLFATRGAKGLLAVLAFVAAFVACYLVSLIVYFVVVGLR